MKRIGIWIIFFIASVPLRAQEPTPEVLADLTDRVMIEIENFMSYVSIIGAAEEPMDVRKDGITFCLKLFSPGAIIEEQSKHSSYKKEWRPEDYLKALLYRGERTPVIVKFKVIDDLLPEELEKIENEDGTVTYKGEMIFRQYYCKLKEVAQRSEPTAQDPNVNCTYSDTTDKKVSIQITRMADSRGQVWVTLISSIRVLRVF